MILVTGATGFVGNKLMQSLKDAQGGHNLWMNCQKAKNYGVEFSDVLAGLIRCGKDYGIII